MLTKEQSDRAVREFCDHPVPVGFCQVVRSNCCGACALIGQFGFDVDDEIAKLRRYIAIARQAGFQTGGIKGLPTSKDPDGPFLRYFVPARIEPSVASREDLTTLRAMAHQVGLRVV
jgi:hypothetical protein